MNRLHHEPRSQKYAAHARDHVRVCANFYSWLAHAMYLPRITERGVRAGEAQAMAMARRRRRRYDGAPGSRLRAHGNVHAQFGAALRGEFDLGARARGGWAGLCENEAPAMDPLKRVLTKCTPVARTPGAPVRPRGNAHINFDDHLGNEPDPGHGPRRKLHAPLISPENHVCAKTPLLPPRVLPRDLR